MWIIIKKFKYSYIPSYIWNISRWRYNWYYKNRDEGIVKFYIQSLYWYKKTVNINDSNDSERAIYLICG